MRFFVFVCIAIIHIATVHAADMSGSADHPKIPRVAGAEIHGFAFSDYDAGNFLVEDANGQVVATYPEGARTRILYLTQPGNTPLMVLRNYDVALKELGETTEKYSCSNTACKNHTLSSTLWTRSTMIPTEGMKTPFYLLGFAHNYTSPGYRYAEVVTDDAKYHVSVFTSVIARNNPNADFRDRTVALVEIVEIKDFEPTLEFVDAGEMQSQIAESGHVALYGIQFDHDKASLRSESEATLAEIVKVLQGDKGLNLYVVGHTDDVGALAYNNDLSLRRATTVVEALAAAGVDKTRLTPLGVGPAAPIASNDSEDGRALNRRVEIVKRSSGR